MRSFRVNLSQRLIGGVAVGVLVIGSNVGIRNFSTEAKTSAKSWYELSALASKCGFT